MSASIIPAVGPAMICASSSTRMPASGPAAARLASIEQRLALGEESRIAGAEVRGVEAVERLVVLGVADRAAFREPACELLVPARDERRALGDAHRGCTGLRCDVGIGNDARHQTLLDRKSVVQGRRL